MSRVVDSPSSPDEIVAVNPAVEANHRIANNLTIIAGLIRSELLALATEAPPDAAYTRRLLQQMSLRIDALGRLHRLLMDVKPGSTVELGSYLRGIAEGASRSFTDATHTKIHCILANQVVVSAKQAAAIGFFVVEAIVNAIKYAHPTDEAATILVTCETTHEDGVVVEIIDDGMGPSPDLGSTTMRTGTGLRLMRGIARELDAKLEFIRGDLGYAVRLEVPAAPNATP